jgi:hypothetical protein
MTNHYDTIISAGIVTSPCPSDISLLKGEGDVPVEESLVYPLRFMHD